MAHEAIIGKDGKPVGREVRPAGAVWSDADLALGELVRFVADDDDVQGLRVGALELTKGGKLRRAKDYEPEALDLDETVAAVPIEGPLPEPTKPEPKKPEPKKPKKPKKAKATKPKKVR